MNFKTFNFTIVFVNCTWYIIACQLNIAAIGFNFTSIFALQILLVVTQTHNLLYDILYMYLCINQSHSQILISDIIIIKQVNLLFPTHTLPTK